MEAENENKRKNAVVTPVVITEVITTGLEDLPFFEDVLLAFKQKV